MRLDSTFPAEGPKDGYDTALVQKCTFLDRISFLIGIVLGTHCSSWTSAKNHLNNIHNNIYYFVSCFWFFFLFKYLANLSANLYNNFSSNECTMAYLISSLLTITLVVSRLVYTPQLTWIRQLNQWRHILNNSWFVKLTVLITE